MLTVRSSALFVISVLALAACERSGPAKAPASPAENPAPAEEPAPSEVSPAFVNRVWVVSESKQVAPGDLRVFLSDGTLVMASLHAKPAFGRWRYEGGRLTITEEGQDYPVDILSLSENAFRIRMHSPGEPVEILFKPAEWVAPEARQDTKGAEVAQASARSAGISIWTVVAYHNPGISALSGDAARKRYGDSVRLTSDAAYSAGQRCKDASYADSTVPADAFLAREYELAPGYLKPLGGQEQIHLVEVSCGGGAWAALGVRILEISKDRALAPWDGVFFELARDRDFRGLGQEPGWQLEIRKGADMRFTYDYGKGTAVVPASRAVVDSSSGKQTYHAVTEGNDLRIEIAPVKCSDAMSGKPFSATVTVTLNERSFRGCGEELATPYTG